MTNTLDAVKSNGHAQVASHMDATRQEYTFPSSGVTVVVNKVSQQRTTDHRNAMRRMDEAKGLVPRVPTQTLDIAGELVTQENPSDPDYTAALLVYTTAFNNREFEWFIAKTLGFEQSVVDEYRARALTEDGTDYSEHPSWYIFLWHIAALDPNDFDGYLSVATSMSQATPAAIADAKERFRR